MTLIPMGQRALPRLLITGALITLECVLFIGPLAWPGAPWLVVWTVVLALLSLERSLRRLIRRPV